MRLKHRYNTEKSLPAADEYWSFAFFGWLLLVHDDGSLVEVEANYATSNQIRVERVISGRFSGSYKEYTIIGYKIKEDLLRKNKPDFFHDMCNQYLEERKTPNVQLKLEF